MVALWRYAEKRQSAVPVGGRDPGWFGALHQIRRKRLRRSGAAVLRLGSAPPTSPRRRRLAGDCVRCSGGTTSLFHRMVEDRRSVFSLSGPALSPLNSAAAGHHRRNPFSHADAASHAFRPHLSHAPLLRRAGRLFRFSISAAGPAGSGRVWAARSRAAWSAAVVALVSSVLVLRAQPNARYLYASLPLWIAAMAAVLAWTRDHHARSTAAPSPCSPAPPHWAFGFCLRRPGLRRGFTWTGRSSDARPARGGRSGDVPRSRALRRQPVLRRARSY